MFGNNEQHVNSLITDVERERGEGNINNLENLGIRKDLHSILKDFLFSESLKLNYLSNK